MRDEHIFYGSTERSSIEHIQLEVAQSMIRSHQRRRRQERLLRADQLWSAAKIVGAVLFVLVLLSAVTPNL